MQSGLQQTFVHMGISSLISHSLSVVGLFTWFTFAAGRPCVSTVAFHDRPTGAETADHRNEGGRRGCPIQNALIGPQSSFFCVFFMRRETAPVELAIYILGIVLSTLKPLSVWSVWRWHLTHFVRSDFEWPPRHLRTARARGHAPSHV